jgi:hypothetical protein
MEARHETSIPYCRREETRMFLAAGKASNPPPFVGSKSSAPGGGTLCYNGTSTDMWFIGGEYCLLGTIH